MTKEERAEKWFRSIPNSETVSMEARMKICTKVGCKLLGTFFIILAAECIVLFFVNNGAIFTWLANVINNMVDASSTKNHYKGLALVSSLLMIPFLVIPLIVVSFFKNRWIETEVLKIIKEKE